MTARPADRTDLRVAADLRTRITAREYEPGDPLPSEPALADHYNVPPDSVRHALELLTEECLVECSGHGDSRKVHVAGGNGRPVITAYRRIMHSLRARLAAGEFGIDDRLPSETQLRAQFGVSRNTVRHARRELVDEGLIIVRHGAGAFPAPHTAGLFPDGHPTGSRGPTNCPHRTNEPG